MRPSKATLAIVLALILLTLIPRLPGIGDFATIDEPYWLTAGSDFYYALGQRDFANTVYDYHPAVTTMWIVTAAMLLYFPQYRGLGQGYFDVYKDSLDQFLLENGRSALGLMTTARILQAVLIVGLLVCVFLLLRRLVDERAAGAAALLISFDPFFLGHSRLLNHEGMMSLFALVSLLAVLVYLFRERRGWLLASSGVAAGLAQLTKSSAVVLLPVIGGLFVLAVVTSWGEQHRISWPGAVRDLSIWMAAMIAVYVLLWPGMWVAPAKMLTEVFGNAASYALQGARLSAAPTGPPADFQPQFVDITLYLQSMLWRTTPIAWIGAILAIVSMFRFGRAGLLTLAAVFVLGALFILLFGIASGRNSAHYVLTSYAALDILAALGFSEAARWLGSRWRGRFGSALPAAILGAAVILQGAGSARFYPYYYNYYSPIMEALDAGRQNSNFGYGEGLDLAAAYLNAKPGAAESTAMAFYGRGPFSFFYKGNTEPLKTVYADAENVPQLQQILRRTDYLVIYYALQAGRNAPANMMRALAGVPPEKVIWLNGIEYVRIYAMRDMPADFLERLQP